MGSLHQACISILYRLTARVGSSPKAGIFFSPKTTASGASHATPSQHSRSVHLCEAELGRSGRHRPARGAAPAPAQQRLPLSPGPGRGRGFGPRGLRRGRRSGGGTARRAQRMTASYPAAAAELPAPRASERPPPPAPGAPRRGQPGTARDSPARLCRRRRGRSAFPSRSGAGAAAVRWLPAPPEVLTASGSTSAAVPARLGAQRRCQPEPRRCSGIPGAAAGSGVHLRPAPLSARASSASPLLASLGLIFHRSAAPIWGRLPPRQLVFCTALSPFSAISNLHALSFLRYRLILVWRSRFAILSHAHSCG